MIRAVVLSLFCVAYAMSMTTTHKPHQTHHPHGSRPTSEPAEHEFFRFSYEPHTHMMVVVNGHLCYMFTLSDAERAAIHTDAGIRAVELKLLSTLSTASVTEVTKDQIDVRIAHACGAHTTHYYKETTV
ncbi:uncharacterized protein LOC132715050 [Ruditapes philippinarum]|uniref:uncharacterized protein LOC132715050 n=1 Tax=Ruditapes philippinarum TaxID=129788 RepID=UPI00295B83B3|nr:uncharacterized protein LOC132715050 [Ruditapes philippinarum]